jgi:hypothetical protein
VLKVFRVLKDAKVPKAFREQRDDKAQQAQQEILV